MSTSDRRQKFRKGLNSLYLPVYDAICENLDDHWAPFFGIRTIEEQDALFASGRHVTRARGGESAHNYGCATDWTVWQDGKPLWPPDHDSVWREYQQACEKSGAHWGVDFGDKPHNQLSIKVPWKAVGNVYHAKGMDAALAFIKANLA
jgi:hypothetical protein